MHSHPASLKTGFQEQFMPNTTLLKPNKPVGIIGGATKVHPAARAAIKLMGVKTASGLAEIIVAVGLAQNMAALRALATEGIQRGHMTLHARQVAIAAGAGDDMIEKLAAQLVAEKTVRIDRAEEILKKK
jgi:hydroxymethylglutaryl-CoA reductase